MEQHDKSINLYRNPSNIKHSHRSAMQVNGETGNSTPRHAQTHCDTVFANSN